MRHWHPNNPRPRTTRQPSRPPSSLVGTRRNQSSRRDKDGNGTLDKQEVKEALNALGFTFIEDKQVDVIFKRADGDKNGS